MTEGTHASQGGSSKSDGLDEIDGTDAIEVYLDDLADRLRLRGRHLRHVLAEVDDHLAAGRAAALQDGLDAEQAAARAVEEFGPADLVARRLSRTGGPLTSELVAEGVLSLLLVAAIGVLSIGVSGLAAWGAGAAFGKPFVSGNAPDVVYTAQRCAEYREYAPSQPTCVKAAMVHHFGEVVGYRMDAGVLGLLALGAWLAAVRSRRRRATRASSYDVLPAGFAATVGAALFGAAAAITLSGGLLELVIGGRDAGSGSLLSAGVVATLVFAGFALSLWRSLSARLA